jgi:hypothetical protein
MGYKTKAKRLKRKYQDFDGCLQHIKTAISGAEKKGGGIVLFPKGKYSMYANALSFLKISGDLNDFDVNLKKLDDEGQVLGIHITPANNPD